MSRPLYVITARIRAKPGQADRYEALVRAAIIHLKGHPCFVAFNLHRGDTDRDLFLFYEVWADAERYEALRDEPFFRNYLREREGLIEAGVERSNWAMVEQHVAN